MHLSELIDEATLQAAIDGKYIRTFQHPTLPLVGFNYTEKAQYEQRWDAATRNCRGLIVDDAGEIVARPYPKFHNLAEHDGDRLPVIAPATPCVTYDKLDGSLIIMSMFDGEMVLATRGSFQSDQAKWAKAWLGENLPNWHPRDGLTYLFEAIYRENQIVIPYDYEGLVLLGCHETDSMTPVGDHGWPGRVAEVLPATTIAEAAALPPRVNAEGVVCVTDTGVRVKVKQDDYVAKHRVATNITEKTVWEHLSTGRLGELIDVAPDEFHKWIEVTADSLGRAHGNIHWLADSNYIYCHTKACDYGGPERFDRARFAELAKECQNTPILFAMLDGKDWDRMIWDMVKPRGDSRPKTLVEVDNVRLEDAFTAQGPLLAN